MKKLVTVIAMVVLVATSQLFAQVAPKKEFTMSISDKNIALKPGETKSYDIKLNRSKAYNRTKIELQIVNVLPEGLTVSFENGTDPKVDRILTVTASKDMAPYMKSIVLKGKTSRASKGLMLNLNVNGEALTSK